MTWASTPPPDADDIVVHRDQEGDRILLTRIAPGIWRRGGTKKQYTADQLNECARRSGWRFAAVDLPPLPARQWEDDEPWDENDA